MYQFSKRLLIIGAALMTLNTAYASSFPNNDNPTTFIGPTLRGTYTNSINYATAYSVLGEAGLRNFRIGGTVAYRLADNQRIKVSAEYLWEKLDFAFAAGDADEWVNQGAVGVGYQYDLAYDFNPQLNLNAYYSHAPSSSLGTISGVFINPAGVPTPYTDARHIAGSNAAGIVPGVSISPWMGTRVGLGVNYDYVSYDTIYYPSQNATGFGGTIYLNQALTTDINLNLLAGFRQPFNDYEASLNWADVHYIGRWTFGVFGNYIDGKNSLVNTWNLGLSANFYVDPCIEAPLSLKGDLKGEGGISQPTDNFITWAADPAVYMPQVLAIVDQKACSDIVTVLTGFGVQSAPIGTSIRNSAFRFSGSNLTFSVSVTPNPAPNAITIDPITGVLTFFVTAVTGPVSVTVSASNGCSSASTTFPLSFVP